MSLDSLTPSTIMSLGTTATDFASDNAGRISAGAVKSLFTASVTTATSSIGPDINIKVNATRNYVSSMSIQEIDQLLLEIDQQESDIALDNIDAPKVKTLEKKNKF